MNCCDIALEIHSNNPFLMWAATFNFIYVQWILYTCIIVCQSLGQNSQQWFFSDRTQFAIWMPFMFSNLKRLSNSAVRWSSFRFHAIRQSDMFFFSVSMIRGMVLKIELYDIPKMSMSVIVTINVEFLYLLYCFLCSIRKL